MKPVTLDFETYWATGHSLTNMLPSVYVMHPDTEIISCSMKVEDGPTDVAFGEDDVRKLLQDVDWSESMAVGHNMSGFDCMILAWRFGIHPKMWACTMAMARPHHRHTGLSLAKLSKLYGLGEKDMTALVNTKGKHLADFTPMELDAMQEYNAQDTELTWALFRRLLPKTPAREMWLIDSTVRMLAEPRFVLDRKMCEVALERERANKRKALLQLAETVGIEARDGGTVEDEVRDTVMSAPRFAALLTKLGVDVPLKESPTNPGHMIPALAKSDEAFLALTESNNVLVATAARTRLDIKSTLLETRLASFISASDAANGYLPIPVRYAGAHTYRDSGEQYNPQNLPRIGRDGDGKIIPALTNALRLSMRAPPGYVVGVADQSGIELRVNHFLWKVEESMRLYADDPQADLYRAFAAVRYRVTPEQVTKAMRQLAKVAQLGLGFGAAWRTFKTVAKIMGGLDLSDEEAQAIVTAWRDTYYRIVNGWQTCHESLRYIQAGERMDIDPWGLTYTDAEGIVLPSGRKIRYPNLRVERNPDNGRDEWKYGQGRETRYIYGGRITENIVQALACDSIMDCSIAFYKETKLRPVLRVHDELVYMFPESEAQALLDTLQNVMRTPPKWWPELIVWSEGDIAPTYGHAK